MFKEQMLQTQTQHSVKATLVSYVTAIPCEEILTSPPYPPA